MGKISKSRMDNPSQTLFSHPKTRGGKGVGGSRREIETKKSIIFGKSENKFILEDLKGKEGEGRGRRG